MRAKKGAIKEEEEAISHRVGKAAAQMRGRIAKGQISWRMVADQRVCSVVLWQLSGCVVGHRRVCCGRSAGTSWQISGCVVVHQRVCCGRSAGVWWYISGWVGADQRGCYGRSEDLFGQFGGCVMADQRVCDDRSAGVCHGRSEGV